MERFASKFRRVVYRLAPLQPVYLPQSDEREPHVRVSLLSTQPEEGAQLTRMDDMLGLAAPHEAHGFGLGLADAKCSVP